METPIWKDFLVSVELATDFRNGGKTCPQAHKGCNSSGFSGVLIFKRLSRTFAFSSKSLLDVRKLPKKGCDTEIDGISKFFHQLRLVDIGSVYPIVYKTFWHPQSFFTSPGGDPNGGDTSPDFWTINQHQVTPGPAQYHLRSSEVHLMAVAFRGVSVRRSRFTGRGR